MHVDMWSHRPNTAVASWASNICHNDIMIGTGKYFSLYIRVYKGCYQEGCGSVIEVQGWYSPQYRYDICGVPSLVASGGVFGCQGILFFGSGSYKHTAGNPGTRGMV